MSQDEKSLGMIVLMASDEPRLAGRGLDGERRPSAKKLATAVPAAGP